MPTRRKRKKEPDKPEIQSNLSEEEWIEKGKNSDFVGFLAWETFFRMRRTSMAGLFYAFGCKKFCKHIMAGLFGFFLPISIF